MYTLAPALLFYFEVIFVARFALIELHKEELKFSAGHLMFLSATQRESMHGHDYQVSVAFKTLITHNGIAFDSRFYKDRLTGLCQILDYHFILPSQSEYMRIEETETNLITHFNGQIVSFLREDAVVLPICNVTLEELSNWFLTQLMMNEADIKEHQIKEITVKVFNGRGESGATTAAID
jgi:6-pyruvoyltetrahydropterin/6-carboxytetrahydropterin synthase